MRFLAVTTLAAFLVGAAPTSFDELLILSTDQVNDFEVSGLGGMTFRAQQQYNKNFISGGRGPRSYLKALAKYSSFGATVDPQLVCIVNGILQDLGLAGVSGAAGAGCSSFNGGTGVGSSDSEAGTGTGTGTGIIIGNGNSSSIGSGGGGTGGGDDSRPTGVGSSTGARPENAASGGQAPKKPRPGNGPTGSGQGSVAADPEMQDVEYLSPVRVGTPGQTLFLDFDTGSSDLWVFSSLTPGVETEGHSIFNLNRTRTARRVQGAEWQISYGDGSSAEGIVYRDTVSIGGVTVRNQVVEVATAVSGTFTQDAAISGLLGLGMDSINQVKINQKRQPQKTFFSNAKASLAMPVFSVNLKAGAAGNYNFGFIDQTEYTGAINFVPVNQSSGFWQFSASGFKVGNGQPIPFRHRAIADTGTTLMLMPPQAVQAYYSKVRSAQNSSEAGGVVFDCGETLPSFTVLINGYQAVVPGKIIKFAPVNGTAFTPGTQCFGGIQAVRGLSFAIYGDIFLKAQFTVFDAGKMRIGFAAKSPGN